MPRNDLLFYFEKKLAELLLNKLKTKEISAMRASEIASFFLQNLPSNSTQQETVDFLKHLADQKEINIAHADSKQADRTEENFALMDTIINYLEQKL